VPTLNFNNNSLYETLGLGDSTSPVLHRITLATSTGMSILPMKRVLAVNTSYIHEFEGPSLKCETATGYRLQNISAVVNETKQQVLATVDFRPYAAAEINYLSFSRDEDGLSANATYNVTTFVSECLIGNAFRACDTSRGDYSNPVLWARMGEERASPARSTTHASSFGLWHLEQHRPSRQ
jgi:hypothetical protein